MNAGLTKSIFVSIIALLAFMPLAGAADFVVGISDLSVTPTSPFAGDSILISADYSLSASFPARVRIELLFDGNIAKSLEEIHSTGNYEATFNYTPSSSITGNHDVGVRIRTYDGSILKDEDLLTKTIAIKPTGTGHQIDITSISTGKTPSPSERFPVTVDVSNKGNAREEHIVISANIGGNVYFSGQFSLDPGQSTTQTINVPAPATAGTYDLTLSAYSEFTSDVASTTITVQGASISLTLKKTSAITGEWVEIYGYATRGNYASENAVSLYLDGNAEGAIPTRGNGYYSSQVKFDMVGSHKITVIGGGLTSSQNVYISAQQATPAPQPGPQPRQITVPSDNYTAIIVVNGDGQYVVYPKPAAAPAATNAYETKIKKYENFSFVNIDVSTKEIDVVENIGNVLKITVSNHLGHNELFSVSTDFNSKWSYIPAAEVIANGKKKVFEIYFSPDRAGTFSGSVFVMQNGITIKAIPVSMYVTQKERTESMSLPLLFNIGAERIAILAMLLALTIFALHFGFKKTNALEPRINPPSDDVSEILRAMKPESNGSKTVAPNSVFYAPRDKIIT